MALKYVLEGRKYCKDDDLFQLKLDYIEAYILSDLNLPERAIPNYNSISRRLKEVMIRVLYPTCLQYTRIWELPTPCWGRLILSKIRPAVKKIISLFA